MIKKIEQTIKEYSLLEAGDRIVVALSGGADSCALLLSLVSLAPTYHLTIFVAHFNHGLRGVFSDEDEAFCRSLAEKFGLIFKTQKMQNSTVPKGYSPEDYFRQERYRFLDRVAMNLRANKIALGHHLQDQAETVLMNILRGSGLEGLKGILPMRDNRYIRPLVEVSRSEIFDYLNKSGVEYRQDASNSNVMYLRNRVRHELIPLLKEKYNPAIEQNLSRMAGILRRDEEWINESVRETLASSWVQKTQDEVSLSVESFKTLHAAIAFRVIKGLLESMAPSGGGFAFTHIQSLVNLAVRSASGKSVALPYGLMAQKEYDRLVITIRPREKSQDYEYAIKIPGRVVLEERQMILSMKHVPPKAVDYTRGGQAFFDGDRIRGPLVIRNRRNGDWFVPLGTQGSQKIKKLFIDRKIPRRDRDHIALIADRESVIWIEKMHQSERVKVSPETKNVVRLEFHPF